MYYRGLYEADMKKAFIDLMYLACNEERFDLFKLLPDVLPHCKNPSSLLNDQCMNDIFKSHLFDRKSSDRDASSIQQSSANVAHPTTPRSPRRARPRAGRVETDCFLFYALIDISRALVLAAENHPLEKKDLDERLQKIEDMLHTCFDSDAMDKQENLVYLLSCYNGSDDKKKAILKKEKMEFAYSRAETLIYGPLSTCIDDERLTKILGTAQISSLVDQAFKESLLARHVSELRNPEDLFQLRFQSQYLRYNPRLLFFFFMSTYFVNLFLVSLELGLFTPFGFQKFQPITLPFPILGWKEVDVLLIMVVSMFLNEVGEVMLIHKSKSIAGRASSVRNDAGEQSKQPILEGIIQYWVRLLDALKEHYCDTWNWIDAFTVLLQFAWCYDHKIGNTLEVSTHHRPTHLLYYIIYKISHEINTKSHKIRTLNHHKRNAALYNYAYLVYPENSDYFSA